MGMYAMTGGATGIGAAIKAQLLSEGHEVIVIDIKDADIKADLSSREGRELSNTELAKRAEAGLDGFIACAGVGSHINPPSLIARINYFGAIASIEGARDLVAKKKGAMLIVSSTSAMLGHNAELVALLEEGDETAACAAADALDGHSAYAGGKLALTRWMRLQCVEYAKNGVRLNAIAPGYTETPLTAPIANHPDYGAAISQYKASIPVGFAGTPEDQASAACFLLSPQARYICGSVLFVDGGSDAMARRAEF